jgi:hypothetical protein
VFGIGNPPPRFAAKNRNRFPFATSAKLQIDHRIRSDCSKRKTQTVPAD